MPLKLDQLDFAILKVLSEDGRRSYREIARLIGISSPTVEARLKRIMESGLISRIAPIFNVDKVERGVSMLISLKVEASKLATVASEISRLPEIKGVFITTGESNLLVRIAANNYEKTESIISDKIAPISGVSVLNTQIITRTLKDEQGVIIESEISVKLGCEYCKKPIAGDPTILKLQDSEHFFCCGTCLSAYKEKYGSRLHYPP